MSEKQRFIYRLSADVGIEVLVDSDAEPQFTFEEDGLSTIQINPGFEGKIVIHRMETPDASSIYTGTSNRSNLMDIGSPQHSERFNLATKESEDSSSTNKDSSPQKDSSHGISFLDMAGMAAAAKSATVETPKSNLTMEGEIYFERDAPIPEEQPKKSGLTPSMVALAKGKAKTLKEGETLKERPSMTKSLSKQKSLFRKAALATKVKCKIPESILEARIEEKSHSMRPGSSPTMLHELCARENVGLEELFDCLADDPEALRVKDTLGRHPLHILGDNEALITSMSGRETATIFAGHIINEYPSAALNKDNDGFLPFCRIIADWLDYANDQEKLKKGILGKKPAPVTPSPNDESFESQKNLFYDNTTIITFSTEANTPNWLASTFSGKFRYFPRVELWEETEWCFKMLSTVLDILARNNAVPSMQRERLLARTKGDERKMFLLALLEKLDNLIPTVLLIDDDGQDSRERVLDMSLFQRLVIVPQIIGPWLVSMLNNGGVPAKRVVDLLLMISKSTIDDFTGGFGAAHSAEWTAFRTERQLVFAEVEKQKGVIASLVTLNKGLTEKAASTAVIWYTMNSKLARPFILGLVMIDLILHLTLMIAFRSIASTKSDLARVDGAAPTSVVYWIASHYILRKVCEAYALATISPMVVKAYFGNVWTAFDTIAILLAMSATLIDEFNGGQERSGLNAFVLGLLWIKVLGFLKVVNREMSTFILALAQILWDIRLFMLVLLVCLAMFGDMFFIAVSQKDDGAFCEMDQDSGTIEDYCSGFWQSYLRTYSMLLGDFELDDIAVTSGTTVLFIMFTVFGVVILLNVLIAVISDSYEKATMKGNLLFGVSRVFYVAQNEALESVLRPKRPKRKLKFQAIRRIIRWTMLLAILATACHSFLFLIGVMISYSKQKQFWGIVIAGVMLFLLGSALWVVGTFILDNVFRAILPDRAENVYDRINRINGIFVGFAANTMFGLNKESVKSIASEDTEEEDWNGKVRYLENVIDRLISNAKTDLKAEIAEVKTEMHDLFEEHASGSPGPQINS